MSKRILTVVLALFVVSMFVTFTATAGEGRPEMTPAKGDVKVTKDDKGELTGVKIADKDIVLDEMGKDLAATMDGKKTEAAGTVADGKLALRRFSVEVVGRVAKAEEGCTVTVGKSTFKAADREKKLEAFDGKDALITGNVMLDRENAKMLMVKEAKEAPKAEEKKAE
ncbi:MAG TPA: hypothetical protein VM223_19490 [Planctomycetota bacterium]|nr:hypothetical protein [Planctomycetota bacterium]